MALHPRLAAVQDRLTFIKWPARDPVADTGAIAGLVSGIVQAVRQRGDSAVREYGRKFDGVRQEALEVTQA